MLKISEKFSQLRAHFNPKLLATFLLLTLCPFTYGFDNQGFATIMAMDGFATSFGDKNEKTGKYEVPPYFMSLLSSLQYIGFAVGLYIGSIISARWGRKWCIFIECIYSWIPGIISITSKTKEQILMGRILNYVYVGMELSVIPVYQSEIAPDALRGVFVSTYQLALNTGGFTINSVCYKTSQFQGTKSWQIPLGLFFILPTFIAICIWFVPESPRWLLTQNREEEALKNLRELRKGDTASIDEEFLKIKLQIQTHEEKGTYRDMVKGTDLKRTFIAIGVNFFLQATGQAFASQYGSIFIKGMGINPFAANLIVGGCQILAVVVCVSLNDRFGRRALMIAGTLIQMAGMYSMGGIGTKSNLGQADKYGIIAVFYIQAIGYSIGWAPLSYLVSAEVPSQRLRDKTQRVAQFVNILTNFVVSFTLPYLLYAPYANLNAKVGFIYGSLALCAVVFAFFCIPECRGRSLEEIDYMFDAKVPIRQFSSHQVVMGLEKSEEEVGNVSGTEKV